MEIKYCNIHVQTKLSYFKSVLKGNKSKFGVEKVELSERGTWSSPSNMTTFISHSCQLRNLNFYRHNLQVFALENVFQHVSKNP